MIWKKAKEKLEKGIELVMLVVVESKGSSPGREGFKMIVCADENLYGSIGGGIMEHNLVELARDMINEGPEILIKNQIHGDTTSEDKSGMICAGSQRVVLLKLNRSHLEILSSIEENEGYSKLVIDPTGISLHEISSPDIETGFQKEAEWKYIELIGLKDELIIFGGGHVSLAVSKLFRELGFFIRVFDNREIELSTLEQNKYADEISIIDYGDAEEYVPEGNHIFVIIMTAGHAYDGLILEQLLSKKIRYLGMMGSEKKVESILKVMKKTGHDQAVLEHVNAPIGLDIKSETPAEIAVSIAAQIIRLKNK